MLYCLLTYALTLFLDLFATLGIANSDKDLEIILLRQQLRILQRKVNARPRLPRPEKLILATLTARFRRMIAGANRRMHGAMLIFQPETVIGWHHELVRRKWTYRQRARPGRPRLSAELEALIVQLARENSGWGYDRIEGELRKIGYAVSPTSVRNVLKRHRIVAAPERRKSTWRAFIAHHKEQMLACDFLTVETIWLQTIYVLFFIELATRRVHFAGCTAHPNSTWVTQQARQLVWQLEDEERTTRFLIHDRDDKFTHSFDTVFECEGIDVVETPYRAPKANAYAERWVRSAREECLDHILIFGERHLYRVMREYEDYFNWARPHQGIDQRLPRSDPGRATTGPIRSRNILGGILHDYYRQPSSLASGFV
jgi:transposase